MVDKPVFEFLPTEEKGVGIPVTTATTKTLGLLVCVGPSKPLGVEGDDNKMTSINFTGSPGTASSLYYALVFQLPKWGFNVAKVDEWIEVSPTHKEYYERTISTKQMLEGVIKSGLGSAAEAVSQFELLNHDLRKYKEILTYFHEKDEHSLKAMFVDQVDIHTGEGISMRSIVSRWPTIIVDFMKLTDKDKEIEDISKKLNVSKAEAVILVTKNKLYMQWKDMFSDAAKTRYELIKGLVEGRKRSVQEYREWLKPYISRFKMTKVGGEKPGSRAESLKSFADITGQATFANSIRVWTWKVLRPLEPRGPAAEIKEEGFVIYPYDAWIRENYILNKKNGLAAIYPWLVNEKKYCRDCKKYLSSTAIRCDCGSSLLESRTTADEIVEKEIIPMWKNRQMGLDPSELYYVLFDIQVFRIGSRLPIGEVEDITFDIKSYEISQNVMLLKLLELKCRELELEKYIDEILGIRFEEGEISEHMKKEFPKFYKEEKLEGFSKFVSELRSAMGAFKPPKMKLPETGLMFVKPGPYEREFAERLSKQYLVVAAGFFDEVKNFLKARMGVI